MKAIMCLGVLAMLAGCGGSKVELETAKMDLSNVTRERDDLKVQVATLERQLATTKADLEKEKTVAAQATTGKASTAEGKGAVASKSTGTNTTTASKKKRAHKS